MSTSSTPKESPGQTSESAARVSRVTVRLAGDSGDGMQLLGSQLTNASALAGNDVATFPDYPAEIRAPRGTRAGVSGFQLQFAAEDVFTPGDQLDALVAMNPAALVTNIGDLRPGGLVIVNEDSFTPTDLKLAGCDTNPLEDGSLDKHRVIRIPMTRLTREAVADLDVGIKVADRCRNFFALGLLCWLYNRPLEPSLRFIEQKFGNKPAVAAANERALRAGWNYGETQQLVATRYRVDPAPLPPGQYRNLMGNQALAWGLLAAARLSGKELFYSSYPITPASDVLHELSRFKHFRVRTFQAEDEIAAMCAAIGAAYGGAMAATASSGPGIALKGEALGLAVMLELPVVVVNVQRGGPSTGLPTKTEQADLFQALFGRHGECPLPVLAARSPADCFDVAIDAWRLAVRYMVPVMILSDGYLGNGSEPWRIPHLAELPQIEIRHPGPKENGEPFYPYERDERLARPWALPGTKGLMHRIGGLEKEDRTGNVSYDPDNHQRMVELRRRKVQNIARELPPQTADGPDQGPLLVLSWGGVYGACVTAVARCREEGLPVAHAHLRYLNPFPPNLGQLLDRYEQVLVPELNLGQLRFVIQGAFLKPCVGLNKVKGRPFTAAEVSDKIRELIH